MKCEKIEELLTPYLEDDLSPEENKAVEEHLKTCQSCSDFLAFIKEGRESLTEFPELDVSENLLDRLYAIPSEKKKFRFGLDFLLRPSLQPVFAAATILLIVFSFYFFHPERKQINKSIDRQVHLGYSKMERLYAKAESFTNSLGAYKDNVLVSLKNIKLIGGNEDQSSDNNGGMKWKKKSSSKDHRNHLFLQESLLSSFRLESDRSTIARSRKV